MKPKNPITSKDLKTLTKIADAFAKMCHKEGCKDSHRCPLSDGCAMIVPLDIHTSLFWVAKYNIERLVDYLKLMNQCDGFPTQNDFDVVYTIGIRLSTLYSVLVNHDEKYIVANGLLRDAILIRKKAFDMIYSHMVKEEE